MRIQPALQRRKRWLIVRMNAFKSAICGKHKRKVCQIYKCLNWSNQWLKSISAETYVLILEALLIWRGIIVVLCKGEELAVTCFSKHDNFEYIARQIVTLHSDSQDVIQQLKWLPLYNFVAVIACINSQKLQDDLCRLHILERRPPLFFLYRWACKIQNWAGVSQYGSSGNNFIWILSCNLSFLMLLFTILQEHVLLLLDINKNIDIILEQIHIDTFQTHQAILLFSDSLKESDILCEVNILADAGFSNLLLYLVISFNIIHRDWYVCFSLRQCLLGYCYGPDITNIP